MSSKTKTDSHQVQSNQVDANQMAEYQGNIANVQNNGASFVSPFTGEMVAGLTPDQIAAENQLKGVAADGSYTNGIKGAAGAVQGILSNLPSGQVSATPVNAATVAGTDLSPYMNPFQNDVINSTMAQLEQQRGVAQNGNNQSAIAAKAFGNNRAGVAQALTDQYYDQDKAATLAGLNTTNFTNAQTMAGADADRRNNVGEFNSNQDLSAQQDSVQNKINSGVLGINAANTVDNLENSAFGIATNQGGILGNVGQQQQTQKQNEDTAALQAWMEGKELTVQQQNMVNQALGLMPVQQTTTSDGTTTQTSDPGMGQILGALGGMAMSAAMPGSGAMFGGSSLLGGLFGGGAGSKMTAALPFLQNGTGGLGG